MNITEYEMADLLKKVESFELQLIELKKIEDNYKKVKQELKDKMVELGKSTNQRQIKWVTPNGTQITCSIGHPSEFKEKWEERFDLDKLKSEYPEIYNSCVYMKKVEELVKNATPDKLTITLPKDTKED